MRMPTRRPRSQVGRQFEAADVGAKGIPESLASI